VQRLHPDAPLPSYALEGDAGADLCTMVDVRLQPGERALLPTGLAIALPAGYAGFVQPRSGLAWRAGLGMVNAPGTIDSGYRGEIKVIVINHDRDNAVELRRGDRIAQLVIQRVEQARFELVEQLGESVRGAAGHGSTGGAGALLVGDPAVGGSAAGGSAAGGSAVGGSAVGDSAVDGAAVTSATVNSAAANNRGDDQ
jgi:dUTP pyrophosphatase